MKLTLKNSQFPLIILLLNLILMLYLSHESRAEGLSLKNYLNQVQEKHLGLKGAKLSAEGAELRKNESGLLVFPTAFLEADHMVDKKLTTNPVFQGDSLTVNRYSLGVKYLSPFGVSGRVYYSLLYTDIQGASPAFLPQNRYHESRPTAEISISLWRNFFGGITSAEQIMSEADALSKNFQQSFTVKQIQAQAEMAYWRLALAYDSLKVQKESLERAQKIQDWNSRRANLGLTDRADLLQANAAMELKRLEYKMAEDDLRSALQNFNSLRGMESFENNFTLESIDSLALTNVQAIQKSDEPRDDLKAYEQITRISSANSRKHLSLLSPDVQIIGAYGLNGRSNAMGASWQESWHSRRPYWEIGLKIEAPLDLPTIFSSRSGHKAELQGDEYLLERKRFEVDQEWTDLTKKLGEAKSRLELAKSIEKIQKEKLLHEKDRHTKGRTTTYQVLMFEQDYSSSQLVRIRIQAEILSTLAQMKTFNSNSGASL